MSNDLKVYLLLKDREWHEYVKSGTKDEKEMITFFDFNELDDLVELMGPDFFAEGGRSCRLMSGSCNNYIGVDFMEYLDYLGVDYEELKKLLEGEEW